ncbi:M56 family metallopeptidase [Nonomuraea sp. NPDC003201]
MTAAIILATYAIGAGCVLHLLIERAHWLSRAPRVTIAIWLAAAASVVMSAALAGVELAFPTHAFRDELAAFVTACGDALSGHPSSAPPRPFAILAGPTITGLAVARSAHCALSVFFGGRRGRRAHCSALLLVGRHHRALDALVVEYDEPAAYCVPGRKGLIVITRGALNSLHPSQVHAVIAHERAHLNGRHHLLLNAAQAVARIVPRLPLFARLGREIPRLVEILADDTAAREHGRDTIATALMAVARASTPANALGVGGDTAVARIVRLLSPAPAPLGKRQRLLAALGVSGLLAGPASVLLAPPLIAFLAGCPTLQ